MARGVAVLLVVTAVGFAVAGARFFLLGFGHEPVSEAYRSFESSIWIPDLVVAMPLLLAAGATSWLRRSLAHAMTALCAGALLFLGILDLSFNVLFADAYPSTAERVFVLVCGVYFTVLGAFLALVSRRPPADDGEAGLSRHGARH